MLLCLLLKVHLSAVDWLTVTLSSCANIQLFDFFVKYFEKSNLFLWLQALTDVAWDSVSLGRFFLCN